MDYIFSGISYELLIILAINFFLIFILFLMNIGNRSKYKKLKAKYNKFMNGLGDANIEQLLENCIEKINGMNIKTRDLENQINSIERNLIQCVQKIGVVRYNAFDNVGSDLSFSIALLDNSDSGIILSGIYARDSSLTYAKPVISGKSKYALSAEEIQALETARKSSRERIYTDKHI
ncbi:MAG: DUF4446 family protein [Clostridia bacterium]|nr:DUF4446 family protein [Clostridia bacterium]